MQPKCGEMSYLLPASTNRRRFGEYSVYGKEEGSVDRVLPTLSRAELGWWFTSCTPVRSAATLPRVADDFVWALNGPGGIPPANHLALEL
jgi:hypothetical protein